MVTNVLFTFQVHGIFRNFCPRGVKGLKGDLVGSLRHTYIV